MGSGILRWLVVCAFVGVICYQTVALAKIESNLTVIQSDLSKMQGDMASMHKMNVKTYHHKR